MIARHKYQILFWLCIAATVTASLMPGGGKPLFQMQDKVIHAVIYGLLFFCCAQAYSNRFSLWLLALVLVGFGFSMEFAQSMTAYRFADGWDMLANSTGILIVWALMLWQRRAR
jgi:glycopeptide antibiotics resistance protein